MAVFEGVEGSNDMGWDAGLKPSAYIAPYIATLEFTCNCWGRGLVDDLEAVFLNNRIGQDFLRDTLQLLLSFFTVPAVQIQDEKFALADVFDGLITQAGERVVDSLALGIEDRAFWHNPDVCFHAGSITFAPGGTEGAKRTVSYFNPVMV